MANMTRKKGGWGVMDLKMHNDSLPYKWLWKWNDDIDSI